MTTRLSDLARQRNVRDRATCYAIYNEGLRCGLLVRPNHCSACGKSGRVDGHHANYDKPLDVEWLCRSCRHARHRLANQRSIRTRPRCVKCGLIIYWHRIDGGFTRETEKGIAHDKCRRKRKGPSARLLKAIEAHLNQKAG